MGEGKAKKRRGRPPLTPGKAKRASFNTRLTDALKKKLEAEALSAGRSLSEEIERRLEGSFKRERSLEEILELRYGKQGAALLLLLGREMRFQISMAGPRVDHDADWMDNSAAYSRVAKQFARSLRILDPSDDPGDLSGEWGWLVGVGDASQGGPFAADLRKRFGTEVEKRVAERLAERATGAADEDDGDEGNG